MPKPTVKEIRDHIREHFGLTMLELVEVLNTPLHPSGMRDEFAGQAMQALINGQTDTHRTDRLDGVLGFSKIAQASYAAADAMLEARTKKGD